MNSAQTKAGYLRLIIHTRTKVCQEHSLCKIGIAIYNVSGNVLSMRLRPLHDTSKIDDVLVPSPVRQIKPPTKSEPAELQTIATILLRRNKVLFEGRGKTKDRCLNLLSISDTRTLTEKEAKQAIAYVALLKEKV